VDLAEVLKEEIFEVLAVVEGGGEREAVDAIFGGLMRRIFGRLVCEEEVDIVFGCGVVMYVFSAWQG
jgi:hypothetical protein